MSTACANTRWVRTVGSVDEGGVVMTVDGSGGETVGLILDVERRFFGVAFRWPLAVARDLGRNFRTASAVRPGQVAKKFFSMACVQVDMDGLKHARCKKSMSSIFVFCSYALFAQCS